MKKTALTIIALLLISVTASAEKLTCDDEIIAFFQTQRSKNNTNFCMETTPEMYGRLTEDDWRVMRRLQVEGGIINAAIEAESKRSCGSFAFSQIEFLEDPLRYVSEYEEFPLAIQSCKEEGFDAFSIIATGELFQKIEAGNIDLSITEALSPMKSWSERIRKLPGCIILTYSDVSYSDEPRVYCLTENDVHETMKAMSASKTDTFTIVCDSNLYGRLTKNDYRMLRQIEGDAKMVSSKLAYSSDLNVLYYSEVRFESEGERLGTIEDICTYIEVRTENEASIIPLFCTEEMYRLLDAEDILRDMLSNAGILNASIANMPERLLFVINVMDYYPGYRIGRAHKAGDVSSLTDREREAYEICKEFAGLCIDDEPWKTAVNIHDAICSRVSYCKDERDDEKDSVIGALLNHSADCDGYSDAFYAIACIAGLEVRYQTGKTGSGTSHMWNLINLNGEWRAADLTWDDEGSTARYLWFNIGKDRLNRDHDYDARIIPVIEETTDLEHRPDAEYVISNETELEAAVLGEINNRSEAFYLFFERENEHLAGEVLKIIHNERSISSANYLWDEDNLCFEIEDIVY